MTPRRDDPVAGLAREIAALGAGQQARVFRMSWWSDRLMGWAMANPAFKTQLFRFVDVFPATTDDRDVLRHVVEYFRGNPDLPRSFRMAVAVGARLPASVTARIARRNIRGMARQFIAGTDGAEAEARLRQAWDDGRAFTVDLLGEKVVTEAEADGYAARVRALIADLATRTASWPARPLLDHDDIGVLPRMQVSIKPTALASHYSALTPDAGLAQARARLVPILQDAARHGAFVWFDMEHYAVKDLTLRLFRDLLDDPALADVTAGIVIQAYLKDSHRDLAELLAWAGERPTPISVRLVKGAYWDAETIEAEAEGWPVPVFEDKTETDANYERCTRLLHDHHGKVRAAFASHNLRSLAFAVVDARQRGIPDDGYELQMLYGMAEPMQSAITELGLRLRVYAPVGELVPGMAYLVRRLLENTSNESFVRQRFAESRDLDELLAAPDVDDLPERTAVPRRPRTDSTHPTPYDPEPPAEWRDPDVRARYAEAVTAAQAAPLVEVPAVVAGRRFTTVATIDSTDPTHPARVVARSASCGAAEADRAVEVALEAWAGWRHTAVRDRADVIFGAAHWMRERREELTGLMVIEAGKPWREADTEVCEAIDFCEYYARTMLELDRGRPVQSPPGESNVMRYQPKGVGAVIGPWNFPLAIPTGMTVGPLVAGNAVILKPAEQTPAIAFRIIEALESAGLPPGVVNFLPGRGEDVGARLVEHPDVAFIVFTGSRDVGLAITEIAARRTPGQRHVKRVIAEMGGKNALIVDADADLDQAVPLIVQSAFGFSGQKCSAASRLVVVDAVHDQLVTRLAGAVAELEIGSPATYGTQVGPVIDADAHAKVTEYVELASVEGEVLVRRDDVPCDGWFVGPTVVAADPSARVATEEIFGPVLTVLRVPDFDTALEVANDTEYALTAGILSRSPANIERATAELRAGNVYVNRGTTGAVVGRQPFGGFGLSGVGSKAGGPDYLLQFLDPRVVTENTMRQGFAPATPLRQRFAPAPPEPEGS
ncbi:MAG TPA: proline dehydrogenase family protein, partial [Acidimicrobiales bacterium]|nr:proline dehydrogenase family protein [Acidimicrobiales bacterium]